MKCVTDNLNYPEIYFFSSETSGFLAVPVPAVAFIFFAKRIPAPSGLEGRCIVVAVGFDK